MRGLTRITIAVDDETLEVLKRIARGTELSYSAIVRSAVKSFSPGTPEEAERLRIWSNMLSKGEHVILDVDHYLLFLKYVESSPRKEAFYREGVKVALSHAEQLLKTIKTPEDYLKRLEACNLFKLVRGADGEYTLVLSSELSKRFIKELVSTTMSGMGFKFQIKEDLAKLRVEVGSG
jgi:predicted transcriptional regulator